MVLNGVLVKRNRSTILGAIATVATVVGLSTSAALSQQSGTIMIDGSSTVYPITEAVAEEFMAANPGVQITVGISGTGGGFSKFCAGETVISDASRPIKESEIEACRAAGIEYIELPVAYDALTVVVNSQNTWLTNITPDELQMIWSPDSQGTITRWNQVRSEWPDEEIVLYGPGTDSGTFDYFTEAIMGEAGASRSDYTASEDDNVLVLGVSGDEYALGYFGLAYFEENSDRLNAVPVDDGNGPIEPTPENVNNGTYTPLSRPLFIYVNADAANRPEVREFVEFYLNRTDLVSEVGYVPLPSEAYTVAMENFRNGKTGSVFAGRDTIGIQISDLLRLEGVE
jgi:phosphate transport system substrate-binding protein